MLPQSIMMMSLRRALRGSLAAMATLSKWQKGGNTISLKFQIVVGTIKKLDKLETNSHGDFVAIEN